MAVQIALPLQRCIAATPCYFYRKKQNILPEKITAITARTTGAGTRQRPVMLAIALSLLLHALGFWYLIEQTAPPVTASASADGGPLRIRLTPLQPHAAQALPAPPARPAETRPKQVRQAAAKPASTPGTSIAPADGTPPAPADDMLTQLNAARQRRADAAAQQPALEAEAAVAPEDDAQRANRIARANIAAAHPGAQGSDKDDHGGVFQIRRIGLHSAEFMFRGWNVHFRRDSTQLVNVDQGADDDIRIAVVKKMIELIRRHKSGDFIWDSHRLDKQFTLSARTEHGSELQQFLLREFFPDYVAAAR